MDGYEGGVDAFIAMISTRTEWDATERTCIGNDDIQSISDLLHFLYSTLIALLIIRNQLDHMNSRVVPREFVECIGRGRITRTREEDSIGVSFQEGEDEIVADSSVGTGGWGAESSVVRSRGKGKTHRECRCSQKKKACWLSSFVWSCAGVMLLLMVDLNTPLPSSLYLSRARIRQ